MLIPFSKSLAAVLSFQKQAVEPATLKARSNAAQEVADGLHFTGSHTEKDVDSCTQKFVVSLTQH